MEREYTMECALLEDLERMDEAYITDEDYVLECDTIKIKEYVDCYDYYANYGTMYVEKPPRMMTYRGVYI